MLSPDGLDKWSTSTISNIVQNEKYAGNATLQKSFTEDYLTKKRVPNRGEMPKYHVTDSHDAIIDMETFTKVQEEVLRRKRLHGGHKSDKCTAKRRHSKYIFTDLMTCGCCGYGCRRATWTNYYDKRTVYRCANRMMNGVNACHDSQNIDEYLLRKLVFSEISKLFNISNANVSEEHVLMYVDEIFINSDHTITIKYKNKTISTRGF